MRDENIQPKIQEILIKGKNFNQEADSCEIFVFQPENIEEMKLGNLFFVGKIDSAPEATHIINLLTSIIKREYYSNRRRKALASFESGLKKANAAISELTKKESFKWVNKINFISVALIKSQLHFTALGQTKILLLRGNRLTDLTKKLVPAQEKINPKKPFQSIASGKVFINDKIILTTSNLFQYLPQKGLKQILELGQIDQLQTLIRENENIPAQGLAIIDLMPETKLPIKKPSPLIISKTENSNKLPKKINQQLSPFWIKAEEIISDINLIARNYGFKIRDQWKFSALKTKSIKKTSKILKFPKLQEETKENKNISLPPAERLYKELGLRRNKKNLLFSFARNFFSLIENIFQAFIFTIRKIFLTFKNYSSLQKKIYLIGFIILILFAVGGRYVLAQKIQKQISNSENISRQAAEKLNEINKIYYPQNISKIEMPANNFSFLPSQINIASNNILLATASQKTNIIYSLPISGEIKVGNFIPTDLPNNIKWEKTAVNKNSLILLGENNEFYKFDLLSKTSSRLNISLPGQTIVQDIIISNNNIYLLDIQNSQIIKCANMENCQIWLKEEQNLMQAASISIDDSIYILNKNGEINKYFGGFLKEKWNPEIKPFSSEFDKIETKPEFKNIYLSDKKEKRIIIIDKKGRLIKQYAIPEINNINDFQIDSDEKTIFILADEKIYKIDN